MPDGQLVEKWILRKACEDLLPSQIIWRDKEQFDEGSGTADLIATGFEHLVNHAEAPAYSAVHYQARLRSSEECAYHKLLTEAYSGSDVVLSNVARWVHREQDLTY
jgi:asparagine synthase (glutamine-hydrolysing)